jgi:tRNA G18 (ribose-2'-O)-methylase SpoU
VRIDPVRVVDAADVRVADFVDLTDMHLRQRMEPERGVFMAEGHLVIERCVQAHMEILAVLTAERWLDRLAAILENVDVPVYVADEAILEGITGYRVHRGALATVRRPRQPSVSELLEEAGDILVLEDLVDPTNVGLAIRSAVVQGIGAVVISPGCADPLYRKAVKSSMGTVLTCRWARSQDWGPDLARLARSRRMIALAPSGDTDLMSALDDLAQDAVALCFGSEGPGLSRAVTDAAWRSCAIPMAHPEDSLNVAAAVAVACFARSRSMKG